MKPDDLIYYFREKWYWLRGYDGEFTMENQMYHTFSIIVIFALLIMLPTNLLLGFYVSAVLCCITISLQIILFYHSRFRGKTQLAIFLSGISANLFLFINYFYNAGISGPTLMICTVTLFVLMVVEQRERMFGWFVVNFCIMSIISFLEFQFPSLIFVHYSERAYRFADIMTSYVLGTMVLFVGTSYVRSSYQKQKDSASERALTLEKLNAEKDKLFSIISHDLKIPLSSIQQYLNLLSHMEIDCKDRKWIEANLLKATTNTQELLSNLLQWTKNQLEGTDLHLSQINLKTNLKKALDVIHIVAQTKDIKLNTSIADDIVVFADPDMLQLVIRNLLHNAIKFTPKGGIVDILASTFDNKCIIKIIDNGVGMNKTAQEKVFSLKIKSTYGTDSENGTGLGLVLCKEYTELQGGKIWFSSEENVGSVFYLSLPLA